MRTNGARRGWALDALNFFMADMQAGVGPFLGVFLLAHGWRSGLIGTVMTLGGVAGVVVTAPAGALIDGSRHKRLYVVGPGLCVVAASSIILLSQRFWLVAASQVATAIAGAAIVPAVTAMTLGIYKQRDFGRRNGRNQAFNHAGNMFGAALSGLVGRALGLPAIFALAVVFAVFSILSVLAIPAASIDDYAARGLGDESGATEASGLRVLATNRPLLVLAAALAFFHLGNAAMLPLFGMASAAAHFGDPSAIVAITIVVAQGVMVVASIVATRFARPNAYWTILLVSFAALPIRGVVAALVHTRWGVYPVQILDGVGAGLQSVAVPALVARLLAGTGRVNVGQGAVMTAQGVGASLSPALGGWLAQLLGYPAMFLVLGALSSVSLAIWIVYRRPLRHSLAAPMA